MLNLAKLEFELISEADIYLFFKNNIRDGVS